MKPTIVTVRDKRWYVCDYTGGPCEKRYFIPAGPKLRGKLGCFATLPIALRWLHNQEGGETEQYRKTKRILEDYWRQYDIPLAPHLPKASIPLSEGELEIYIDEFEMGKAWRLVPNALKIPEKKRPKKKLKIVTESE